MLKVVCPIFFLSEGRLERNSIAAFLLMVKNLIRHHPVNQESLLHCHGPSTIGAMLSKVSASHHMSVCYSKWELIARNI